MFHFCLFLKSINASDAWIRSEILQSTNTSECKSRSATVSGKCSYDIDKLLSVYACAVLLLIWMHKLLLFCEKWKLLQSIIWWKIHLLFVSYYCFVLRSGISTVSCDMHSIWISNSHCPRHNGKGSNKFYFVRLISDNIHSLLYSFPLCIFVTRRIVDGNE